MGAVVSARMCLADGSIVTVNDEQNTDLFYGIRGGHGQFGVILEFTVQAYEGSRRALTGMLGYRPDQLTSLLEVLHQVGISSMGCGVAWQGLNACLGGRIFSPLGRRMSR